LRGNRGRHLGRDGGGCYSDVQDEESETKHELPQLPV
jgi:hypothetical protein